jgi:hypothetical protein
MTEPRVTWLHARLDEDERVARLATPGPWRYDPDKQWHTPEDLPRGVGGEEFVGAGPLDATIGVAATGPADHPQSMADALFIARHDPVRILREVGAKRRIIGDYLEAVAERRDIERPGRQANVHAGMDPDEYDAYVGGVVARTGALEAVVRSLAAVFADRPDYAEVWGR